jgi:hypothetical protein
MKDMFGINPVSQGATTRFTGLYPAIVYNAPLGLYFLKAPKGRNPLLMGAARRRYI